MFPIDHLLLNNIMLLSGGMSIENKIKLLSMFFHKHLTLQYYYQKQFSRVNLLYFPKQKVISIHTYPESNKNSKSVKHMREKEGLIGQICHVYLTQSLTL